MLLFSVYSQSVVIRYLYIESIAVPPHEADTELLVDGDTVLTLSIVV